MLQVVKQRWRSHYIKPVHQVFEGIESSLGRPGLREDFIGVDALEKIYRITYGEAYGQPVNENDGSITREFIELENERST